MPLIKSTYKPSFLFKSKHLNTIYPALFRIAPEINYQREILETIDGDFIDLDWVKNGHNRLMICFHGLEGSSKRPYVKGMIGRFQSAGWDGLVFNFRSCGGQLNDNLRMYNMGSTGDLHYLIKHLAGSYEEIVLVGFSLGGNMMAKYFGEGGDYLPKQIKGAVAISVPCYAPSANMKIDGWENRAYLKRFMLSLNAKMTKKQKEFPNYIKLRPKMPKNFQEFDAQFTAPVHGYSDAMDYWEHCSSIHFLENIRQPLLMINALDDTFLSKECYPYNIAQNHQYFHLEVPKHGGHCGFCSSNSGAFYWSENRALEFLSNYVR